MAIIMAANVGRFVRCVVLGCLLLLVGCGVLPGTLPDRADAGVLTLEDGSRYMVLTPCYEILVDRIALMYRPEGAEPQDSSTNVVVAEYLAEVPLAPSEVLAPLDVAEPPVSGLLLASFDRELLEVAMSSVGSTSFEDSFFVEVNGVFENGEPERLGGSWAADDAGSDTVVLGGDVMSDPGSRRCGRPSIGWNLGALPES